MTREVGQSLQNVLLTILQKDKNSKHKQQSSKMKLQVHPIPVATTALLLFLLICQSYGKETSSNLRSRQLQINEGKEYFARNSVVEIIARFGGRLRNNNNAYEVVPGTIHPATLSNDRDPPNPFENPLDSHL